MTGNKIEKLLACLCAPAQGIENALAQLLLDTLEISEGVNLDVFGAIVGQARNGMLDVDYRRYIRARILVHRSRGTEDELIAIAKLILNILVTGNVFVRCIDNASFILEIRDRAVTTLEATALQSLLCAATSAGVRIVVEYATRPLAQTFRFDSGPGFDQGHLARGVDRYDTVA